MFRRGSLLAFMVLAVICDVTRYAPPPPARPKVDMATRSVSFTTLDNLVIHAGFSPAPTPEKAPIVILLHMYHSDRSAFARGGCAGSSRDGTRRASGSPTRRLRAGA